MCGPLRRVRQETPRDPAGLFAAGGGFGLGFSEERLARCAGLPAVRSYHGWDFSHSLVVLSVRGRPAACLPGESRVSNFLSSLCALGCPGEHSSRPFPEGTGQRAVLPRSKWGRSRAPPASVIRTCLSPTCTSLGPVLDGHWCPAAPGPALATLSAQWEWDRGCSGAAPP